MRSWFGIILSAALALGAGSHAVAADQPAGNNATVGTVPEGNVLGGSDTGGNVANGPCVDVQIGNERVPDYDCINRQFRAQAEHAHATAPPPVAPIDTHSSSIQLGTANQAAAQQMMGNAFGKSAQPQRPAPPAFVPALPHAGAH